MREPSPTLRRALAVVVGLAVAALELKRLVAAPLEYVVWSDRDLLRASRFWAELPTTGAELSFLEGARVPGSFLYALWSLPLAVSATPEAVYRTGVLLEVVGLVVLAWVVARRSDAWAGAIAATVTASATASVETMLRLWNPAFVPAFVAGQVALGLALAEGGGLGVALGLGLLTALGGQLHAAAVLFGGIVAIGAAVRARRPRALVAFVVGLVVPYLPYLVAEATTGWPNTTGILFGPRPDGPVDRDPVALVVGFLGQLGLGTSYTAAGLAWTSLLHVGTLVGVGLALRGRVRGLGALLVAALALPAVHAVSGRVDLQAGWDGRYVVPSVAVAGVLAGLGWDRLVGALAARSRAAAVGALVLATVAAVAAPLGAASRLPRPGPDAIGFRRAAIAAVQAETGWTLDVVAGRTSFWRGAGPGRWTYKAEDGVAWPLAEAGEDWPGSLPPPCAVVIAGGARSAPVTAEQLQATWAQDLGAVRVLRQRSVGPDQLVLVDVGGGRCPTTLANRYVALPEEGVIAAFWKDVPPDTAREVDGPDGRRLRVVRHLPEQGGLGLGLAVELVPTPGALTATLHAPQLRGHAYNPGLLSVATLGHVRLVLTAGEARVELPFAPDLVGGRGVLTPLAVSAPVPAGTWAVALEAEDVAGGEGREVRRPFRVPLGDVVVP